ncbi:deoxyribonuclease V [Spirulina sp. CCNP1310]|uniref:deoxyribonuclease V n=1 Tax=Spirulina sp. CCNP1310 TaxID=3110249 RepID=UPI002B1E99EE|nr:deoxyribonuclease V [Spirulina sp. CCNP1310]MEA5419452.1 deoxyribonuclease V [Spirulina sp. CCNP1310]
MIVNSFAEAKALQLDWRSRLILTDQLGPIHTVAGLDAAFDREAGMTKGAIAVLRFPELTLVEQATAQIPTTFPYVPGFLSFREVPALAQAWEQLTTKPDLLLCDGQGYAHPRRFGLACHLGVLLDRPAIGVAKSRFIGTHPEPGPEKGDWVPLMDGGERIGAVVRSRPQTKPLYISVGHKISLERAIAYVLQCTPKYRLPETTRQADRLSKTP